ncbi:phosphoadenylyl-sulfate reductase [Sporolactobacillus shoreicorticis]|nr:phosphoadenylyl-sulfate reductase [Sporolactobacillus shoreicorticis]MCO7127680.1 phosphoadenylyl-sulfate reductase [Sporolactobacillus shoreicorticis]
MLPEFPSDQPYKETAQVLQWTFETFGGRVAYSCSFGVEGIVLIDLISKIKRNATIIFLDTNFHFNETYELVDRIEERYPQLNIIRQKPDLTPEEQAAKYGEDLWTRRPDLCCQFRKVDPLAERLKDYDAWISGLRHEQSPTRRNVRFINKDEKFNSIKICPLIHWTWQDVWDYVRIHQLPYNPLHDQNYPSIGCACCTSPIRPGEDQRAGRWSAFDKTECGLHLKNRINDA